MTRKKGAPQRLNDMYEGDPSRSKDLNKEEAASDSSKDDGDGGCGNNTAGATTESACGGVDVEDKQLQQQQSNAKRRLSSLENTTSTTTTTTSSNSKSSSRVGSDKKIAVAPTPSSSPSLSSSCSSALGLMNKFRRIATSTSTTTATITASIPDSKQSNQSTSINNKRQQQQQQQSLFFDTMMRQQLYEQYQQTNWMYSQQQRSESNCLSKSKAERYRWCVPTPQQQQQQAASTSTSASTTTTATNNNNSNKLQQPNNNHNNKQQQQQNNSHVTNLKRSANFSACDVSPMQEKLFSSVFSGASQFSCRDCGSSFDTLVDLTVHMNHTGHYRDLNKNNNTTVAATSTPVNNNHKKSAATVGNSNNSNVGGIPNSKKRRLSDQQQQQPEEKSSENVLTCMECKHSFDSLQDLSVHMMKTRHYENVPSLRTWPQQNHHFNNSTTVTVNNSNNDHKNIDSNSTTTNSRKKSSSSSDENDKQPTINGKINNHTTATASNNNKNSNPLSQHQFASMLTNMPNASALAAYYSAMIYFYPWLSAASLQNSLLTASILHQPAPPLPFLPNQFAQNPFNNLDNVHQQYAAAFQLRNLFTTNNFNNMNPFNISNAITNNNNTNGINSNNNRPNSNGSNNNAAGKNCSEQIAKYSKLLFSNKQTNQQLNQQQSEDKQQATENNSNNKTQTDFINMLEGTVHSALSRVQSSPNPNHSSSKTITKNEVTSGNNSNRSSVSPLDLTLRRENSPVVVNNIKNKQQLATEGKSTVVKREFAAYTGNLPPKDPLQSIKEMFDKRTTTTSTKSNNNLIKLQQQLQQKVAMTASVKKKDMSASNPLREMMKIVNDTDKYNNNNNCGGGKTGKQINSSIETRKFGLDDLVVLPTNKVTKQNPIHDLQKMVNMKLNLPQNISPRQHKTQSTKLQNHLQVQLVQEPSEAKNSDNKIECNHKLLLLQSYFLQKYLHFIAKSEKIKISEKEETNKNDDVDDNDEDMKKILHEISFTRAQFKVEVKRMIEVYNTTSHLPFVKKKDGKILCFSCGVCGETINTCRDFIKHINDEHVNTKLDTVDTCRKPKSPLIQTDISIKQENGQQHENTQRQKQNEKQVDSGAGGEVILAS